MGAALADPPSEAEPELPPTEAEPEPLGTGKDEAVPWDDGVGLAGVLVTPEEVLLGW